MAAMAKKFIVAEKQIRREACEGSLINFAEYVWPVVEPAIPFERGWAIEAIAEHLEAVTYGYIKRLLINVPPGFTKSLLTDVFWPAWEWGPRNLPWYRYMCASYSNHLTERDNMRCRNVVISDRYKRFWGERFKISNEQFTKVKFANNQTGWKLATSVGGIGTGERADRVIIDDPNNPLEMESEAVRDHVNMWFTEIIPDRLNSPTDSAIVVIQQRTHEDDVSGTALTRDMGYTHLMIPMCYDPARHCATMWEGHTWEDPRTKEGELAWPGRFTEEIATNLERDKGPYAWAGQYMQSPEPRGGSIIKRAFWNLWKGEKLPRFEFILASLDGAFTEKEENDFSALTVWGIFREDEEVDIGTEALWHRRGLINGRAIMSGRPKLMLLWAWQERLQFNELVQKVIDTCVFNPERPSFPVDLLVIESKASGISVAQELSRILRGSGRMGIDLIDPKRYGDKVARVHGIQHVFSDGMVYAPDRAYADMVINQCAVFPKGSGDDLVDTTSLAIRYLRDVGLLLRSADAVLQRKDELGYTSPNQNRPLYPGCG